MALFKKHIAKNDIIITKTKKGEHYRDNGWDYVYFDYKDITYQVTFYYESGSYSGCSEIKVWRGDDKICVWDRPNGYEYYWKIFNEGDRMPDEQILIQELELLVQYNSQLFE